MDLTDKGLRDAFTKIGYGVFKALYPIFFLSPGCPPGSRKNRMGFSIKKYKYIFPFLAARTYVLLPFTAHKLFRELSTALILCDLMLCKPFDLFIVTIHR